MKEKRHQFCMGEEGGSIKSVGSRNNDRVLYLYLQTENAAFIAKSIIR
jgi:hypothetical protein